MTASDDYFEVHLFAMQLIAETAKWAAHHDVDAFLYSREEARQRLSFEEYRWTLDRALNSSGG